MSRFQNLEFDDERRLQGGEGIRAKDAGYYLEEAELALEGGNFEQSLRAFSKVLEFDPRSAMAWAGQVRMLIELGEYREAKLWAEKGLELLPNDPELLAGKAVALARAGDLGGALAFSDAAMEERGGSAYVWLARADVMLARRESTAEYCVEKALSVAPVEWVYTWLASRLFSFHQKFAKALALAQRALQLASERAVVWVQLGHCQLALGLASQARISIEQARQLDPTVEVSWEQSARRVGWLQQWRRRWRRWFTE
jgi:tetratricopeptide (TPR) repeat protein